MPQAGATRVALLGEGMLPLGAASDNASEPAAANAAHANASASGRGWSNGTLARLRRSEGRLRVRFGDKVVAATLQLLNHSGWNATWGVYCVTPPHQGGNSSAVDVAVSVDSGRHFSQADFDLLHWLDWSQPAGRPVQPSRIPPL